MREAVQPGSMSPLCSVYKPLKQHFASVGDADRVAADSAQIKVRKGTARSFEAAIVRPLERRVCASLVSIRFGYPRFADTNPMAGSTANALSAHTLPRDTHFDSRAMIQGASRKHGWMALLVSDIAKKATGL